MIVSIPHTGTGFLKKYFKLLGQDVHNVHIRETVAVKDYMEAYGKGESIVIPLRDPAENMLSHWHRRRFNARHHNELAQDWRLVIEQMPEACFVPLDNNADTDRRAEYLISAATREGLLWDQKTVDGYAREWKPLNVVTGECFARIAYREGDYETVKKTAPAITDALEMLKHTAPFWKAQGYQPFTWMED